jgi:hypothetical protein
VAAYLELGMGDHFAQRETAVMFLDGYNNAGSREQLAAVLEQHVANL